MLIYKCVECLRENRHSTSSLFDRERFKILKMKKNTLIFISLLGALALPSVVFGQTIQILINNVINNVVWPIAIGIIVVLWIITGILFLTALGDPSKVTTAKHSLFASLAGTIIIVLAGSVIVMIRNALGV